MQSIDETLSRFDALIEQSLQSLTHPNVKVDDCVDVSSLQNLRTRQIVEETTKNVKDSLRHFQNREDLKKTKDVTINHLLKFGATTPGTVYKSVYPKAVHIEDKTKELSFNTEIGSHQHIWDYLISPSVKLFAAGLPKEKEEKKPNVSNELREVYLEGIKDDSIKALADKILSNFNPNYSPHSFFSCSYDFNKDEVNYDKLRFDVPIPKSEQLYEISPRTPLSLSRLNELTSGKTEE
jgi:hypothetical protein